MLSKPPDGHSWLLMATHDSSMPGENRIACMLTSMLLKLGMGLLAD